MKVRARITIIKDKLPITPIIIVHISLVEGKFMRVVSNPELLEENSDDVLREMRDQFCQTAMTESSAHLGGGQTGDMERLLCAGR